MNLSNLIETLRSVPSEEIKKPRKQVFISNHNTVHSDDWEPVSVIDPQPEGPWICGGAALLWYTGQPVRHSDIDVFCANKYQADELQVWLTDYGAVLRHRSENASTYEYSAYDENHHQSWKIQVITRHYFNSIEDVIDSFDITVATLGTDGNQFIFGDDTLQDITTKTLRMKTPIRAGAVKRYCKYVAYGYRPVPGLHAQIAENVDTTWVFEMEEDYDGF